jgi:hypothetical protein
VETLVGALIGSVLTAAATWWVSSRLDRQRSHRELHAAIGLVYTELEENSRRVAHSKDVEALRNRLTLGDWLASKSAFAGLALREDRVSLWEEVARAYGEVSEFKFGSLDDPPSADNLRSLSSRLRAEQARLDQEIRAFSKPRWLRALILRLR